MMNIKLSWLNGSALRGFVDLFREAVLAASTFLAFIATIIFEPTAPAQWMVPKLYTGENTKICENIISTERVWSSYLAAHTSNARKSIFEVIWALHFSQLADQNQQANARKWFFEVIWALHFSQLADQILRPFSKKKSKSKGIPFKSWKKTQI